MRHNIKVYISGCLLQLLKYHLVAVRGKADSGSKWHLPGKGLITFGSSRVDLIHFGTIIVQKFSVKHLKYIQVLHEVCWCMQCFATPLCFWVSDLLFHGDIGAINQNLWHYGTFHDSVNPHVLRSLNKTFFSTVGFTCFEMCSISSISLQLQMKTRTF